MVYDSRHKLLTVHGTLWGVGALAEEWAFGIRFQESTAGVTQAMANAADAAVRTWWSNGTTGPFVDASHRLGHVKLAPIGTDGKYPPSEISYESTDVALPGTGSATSATPWPSQCALAVTLMTSKPGDRGRASKGRIYLPPLRLVVNGNGLLSASAVTSVCTGVAGLLGALNNIAGMGQAAVFSKVAAGDHYPINRVRGGLVVDTIRRRRRQLAEAPVAPITVT